MLSVKNCQIKTDTKERGKKMPEDIIFEKFSIPYYVIKKEIKLMEGKLKNRGELLLIKDSNDNPVALLNLVGEDAVYKGEPRVRVMFPKDRYVRISSSLRSVILTPAKTEIPLG